MRRALAVGALIYIAALCLWGGSTAFAQGSYQAQVRGQVADQSGAVMTNATVTIINDATNIAQTAFADLTLQKSLAVNEAGDLARRRINRLTEELAQLIKRVIKIDYEILAGKKGELEEEVKQEQQVIHTGTAHRAEEIRADDEHVIWPFTGEYWRDELGYYRVKIRNKCGGAAPEGAPATGETPAAPAGGGDTGGGGTDTGGGAPAGGDTGGGGTE